MKIDGSRHRWVASLAVMAAGMAAPAIAFADDAADRKAEAQRLFVQGQTALDTGDHVKGCELMRTSLELFAVANSLFNVAQCDERDGKLASALEHWKRGQSLIDPSDKRAPVVNKSIEDLEVRVPRLRVVVSPNQEPIDVFLDEEVVPKDKLDAAFHVDPGKHVVRFHKSGYEDRSVDVSLNEKERTEVVATPGNPVVLPPISSPKPPPPPGPSPLKMGGFIALGVGAAGVLGAVITGGLIVSNHAEIKNECPNGLCKSKTGLDLINSQNTLLPVNAVFWGFGIAGAATGAVLLAISSRPKRDDKALTVAPLIGAQGGGIGLSGRF